MTTIQRFTAAEEKRFEEAAQAYADRMQISFNDAAGALIDRLSEARDEAIQKAEAGVYAEFLGNEME